MALLVAVSADARPPAPPRIEGASDPKAGRRLVFAEEFDTLSLRRNGTGRWSPRFHYAGPDELGSRTLPTNSEEQIYVDPQFRGTAAEPLGLNPFSIRDGVLVITAATADPWTRAHAWGYRYTSGLLTSRETFSQTYGYFEIRAKLPRGQGLWPAFWLLPADGSWPPEIDVFEVLGHKPGEVHQTVHWSQWGQHKMSHAMFDEIDASAGFHVYGVEWTAQSIRWFVDGRQTAQFPAPPGLKKPFYLLINLAVGGQWPGPADPEAVPAEMEVDYVRVYAD